MSATTQPRPGEKCGRLTDAGAECQNPTTQRCGYYACWAHVTEAEEVACASVDELRDWLTRSLAAHEDTLEAWDRERSARHSATLRVDDLEDEVARFRANEGQLDLNLRSASSVEDFPYYERDVAWIAIWADGTIESPSDARSRTEALAARADGRVRAVLIAWPGQWTTGVFVVDDEAWPLQRERAEQAIAS